MAVTGGTLGRRLGPYGTTLASTLWRYKATRTSTAAVTGLWKAMAAAGQSPEPPPEEPSDARSDEPSDARSEEPSEEPSEEQQGPDAEVIDLMLARRLRRG